MPEYILKTPEGRLETRFERNAAEDAPIAIILHPHPEHGGTMNSKIVYALYRTFAERGFSVVRFNFRGVGKSEGKFSNGEGELADAMSILDWFERMNPNARQCWVAGFSFGAWVGMQLLMRRPEMSGFIAVSPPANLFDFSFLAPCPVSGMVLQGDMDDIVPKPMVDRLVGKLAQQRGIEIDYRCLQGADHFFSGRLPELMGHVDSYISNATSLEPAVAVNG